MEELFVWCIGLEFFEIIGPKTLIEKEILLNDYSLDRSLIKKIMEKLYSGYNVNLDWDDYV